MERFEDHGDGEPPVCKSNRAKSQKNTPDFDARSHLCRMTEVDLAGIDGVDAHIALNIVSEVGLDMTRWPTAWLSRRLLSSLVSKGEVHEPIG